MRRQPAGRSPTPARRRATRLALVLAWVVGVGFAAPPLAPDVAAAARRAALLPLPLLVPLSNFAPDIVQDMRYATAHNFTGRPVPGYEAAVCWLRPAVAKALARVQADLATATPPLSLAVLDCYRPRRSVAAFMNWARGKDDGATRNYYPSLQRGNLIPKGYIARASTHSRGIAVDLTVVERKAQVRSGAGKHPAAPCTEPSASSADAGLDMGTTFDCFDAKSHTTHAAITTAQRAARQTLKRAMERHGFTNYAKEWWHFTYPAADDGRSFDVPVTAAPTP